MKMAKKVCFESRRAFGIMSCDGLCTSDVNATEFSSKAELQKALCSNTQ